jgi:hypothetical protein
MYRLEPREKEVETPLLNFQSLTPRPRDRAKFAPWRHREIRTPLVSKRYCYLFLDIVKSGKFLSRLESKYVFFVEAVGIFFV